MFFISKVFFSKTFLWPRISFSVISFYFRILRFCVSPSLHTLFSKLFCFLLFVCLFVLLFVFLFFVSFLFPTSLVLFSFDTTFPLSMFFLTFLYSSIFFNVLFLLRLVFYFAISQSYFPRIIFSSFNYFFSFLSMSFVIFLFFSFFSSLFFFFFFFLRYSFLSKCFCLVLNGIFGSTKSSDLLWIVVLIILKWTICL